MATLVETVRALAAVIQAEIPPALVEVTRVLEVAVRDLECACMTSEDLRSASLSPYVDASLLHHPFLTWRDAGESGITAGFVNTIGSRVE